MCLLQAALRVIPKGKHAEMHHKWTDVALRNCSTCNYAARHKPLQEVIRPYNDMKLSMRLTSIKHMEPVASVSPAITW